MTDASSNGTRQDQHVTAAYRQIEEMAPDAAKRQEDLARHTTLGIGGPADLWVKPRTIKSAFDILAFCQRESVARLVLGKGSNVLVSDSGYRGVVINLSACFRRYKRVRGGVRCGAGLGLPGLTRKLAADGLSGLEFAAGIPGTVGGAVRTNAGAHGGEMSHVLQKVLVVTEGKRRVLNRDEMVLSYREGAVPGVVIGAELALQQAAPGRVRERIDHFMNIRSKTQPIWERTAGCVFKNLPGDAAGRLIDSVGLKGAAVGGAKVSELHANFIVNSGGATAADMVALIDLIRKRVKEETGTELELEIELIGKFAQ